MSDVPPTVSDWDDSGSLAALPGWPKAVGIISIVWGSLSVLCGGCGLAWGAFVAPAMMPPDQQIPAGLFVSPAQVAAGGVGLLFNILLIVAGALTVGRKPAGRILHLVCAVASVILFAIGMVLAVQQQGVMQQWVRENPNHPIAKGMSGPGAGIGQVIGYVMAVVLGLLYPLFLLVWFGIIKRKPDSMTGGVVAAEEPAA